MTICVTFSRAREVQQRVGDAAPHDLVERRRPATAPGRASRRGSAPDASPSSGITWTATSSPPAPRGHPRGSADQRLVLRPARDPHQDPLARLPRALDPAGLHVVLQRLVDAVRHPQQRQLAQRAQVPLAEVVAPARRRSSPAGRCCRAPCAGAARTASCRPAPAGPPRRTTSSGIGLALVHAGDALDDVVQRLQVLDVDGRDDVDARPRATPRRPASASRCASPGTFVCASSSTSAISGARARTASTSISSKVAPRWTQVDAAGRSPGRPPAPASAAGRASRRTRSRRPCRAHDAAGPRPAWRTSCRRRPRTRRRCGGRPRFMARG